MTLDTGRRLGPYEIIAPLGAGGMGEVYEARDTRLGRRVAIKVLPEGLAESPERRARLEREAKLISQLSHPHVCALHDVGENQGVLFLVMEHLEGETLAERLARGALPLRDTLRLGSQMAEALDAAHQQGVVHRDLKPSNVMLTASGIKLLDFGLARMAASCAPDAEDLPTMTLEAAGTLTEEGTVLGTYPYMSPEQVEGGATDTRSDIFALGAVLYEMATGKRAFDEESAAGVMAAVLRAEPEPLSKILPLSPPSLDHVVSRCLAKDPEERWQSARDVAGELRWVAKAGSRDGVSTATAKRHGRREWLAWALAAAALATLAGVLLSTPEPDPDRSSKASRISLSVRLPAGYRLLQSSLSRSPVEIAPDESFIVFGAEPPDETPGIFRRSADSLEIVLVAGTEGGRQPFVSPDSRWIGFYTEDGVLAKVPAAGGLRQRIFDTERLLPTGAFWGSDDRIFFSRGLTGGIGAVSSSGKNFEALTVPDSETGEIGHWYPRLLPESNDLLFGAWTVRGWKNLILDLEDSTLRTLGTGRRKRSDSNSSPALFWGPPQYVDTGYLVWLEGKDLVAAPFDIESKQFVGDESTVLSDVSSFHVSRRGTLVYLTSSTIQTSGTPMRWSATDETMAPLDGARQAGQLSISPDGTRLALAATPHVWLVELDRGVQTRLTTDGVINNFPVWSDDGTQIVFNSLRAPHGLYVRAADGVGKARLVLERGSEVVFFPASWAPDGNSIAMTELSPDGQADVAVVQLDSGTVTPMVATKALEHSPAFSPDGRWLAYVSDETGRDEVYVRPYPNAGPRITISSSGGTEPHWSPGGRHLLFRNGSIVYQIAVERDPAGPGLRPDSVQVQAELPALIDSYVPYGQTWDIAPNGDLLYLRTFSQSEPLEIFVLYGWSQTLGRS